MFQPHARLEADVFGILYDSGSQAVFTVDRGSRQIATVNPALEELLGRPRAHVLGTDAAELFDDPDGRDWTTALIERAGLHEDVTLRGFDGYPVFVSLHVTHFDHESGPMAACVATNTTERRLLERELIAKHSALFAAHTELERVVGSLRAANDQVEDRNRELEEMSGQLAAAARRAAIGEFSAGVAHSMNNPMAALSSSLRQIERRVKASGNPELADSLDRFVTRGRSAITRMEQIVNAVRKAHRSGSLSDKPREIDLAEELGLALGLFESRLERIEVAKTFDDDTLAFAPPDAIHHVLSNIVDNAIRAMPDGGTLELEIAASGDNQCVRVRDTGPGVAPELRERLFEPFRSGRDSGTGLGLSTAQRMARAWGGDVFLLPTEAGACFEIAVPRRSPDDT